MNDNSITLENDIKTLSSFCLVCGAVGTIFSLITMVLGIVCISNHWLSISFGISSLLTLTLGIIGIILSIKSWDKSRENNLPKDVLSTAGFISSIAASAIGGLMGFFFMIFLFIISISGGIIIV